MIHWPISDRSVTPRQGRLPSLRDALEALRRLKREGKIRYIGLSNFGVKQLGEVLDLGGEIVVDELAYNLLSRAIERDILPACEQNGIGVVGYSALMQGILSGKYQSMDEIPSNRTRTRHFRGDRPESRHGGPGAEAETWAALSAIRNIATDSGEPMERIALAWSVANPLITCTLAGARNRSQVEENVRGAEIELRPEVVKALSEAGRTLDETLGGNADYYQSDEGSRIW